jgi:hypothetical protein
MHVKVPASFDELFAQRFGRLSDLLLASWGAGYGPSWQRCEPK